jgi:hypothetical protein
MKERGTQAPNQRPYAPKARRGVSDALPLKRRMPKKHIITCDQPSSLRSKEILSHVNQTRFPTGLGRNGIEESLRLSAEFL